MLCYVSNNIRQISVIVTCYDIKHQKDCVSKPRTGKWTFYSIIRKLHKQNQHRNFPPIYLCIFIWLLDFSFKPNDILSIILILIILYLQLLERTMKVECKCHGVSGSCELKTCWRSLASFRMVSFTNYVLLLKYWNTYHPSPPCRHLSSDWPTFNFCPVWKAELVSVLLSPH